MIAIGIIIILFLGCLLYWKLPYSPYKAAFLKKMKSRAEQTAVKEEKCATQEILKLPEPLQRYCQYIRLENDHKSQVVQTIFHDTKFVMDTKTEKSIKMDYDLWLFYDKPFRNAYCTAAVAGVPFDGIDYCTEDGQGGMKGILGKAIRIFDLHNQQGYRASIISWLAETTALNPSGLLSSYISYEEIDEFHVKATVTVDKVSGTGIFTFNKEGAITEFYSGERQVENIDGVMTPVGWRCEYDGYQLENGVRRIHTVRCIKVLPDKEVVYFNSEQFEITYVK